MSEEDKQFFDSSACKDRRLKGCGIFGHMAMMKCQVVQEPALVKQVCFYIAKSQYGKKIDTIQSFLDGKTQLPETKFCVKAKCGWSSSIKCKSKEMQKWRDSFKVQEVGSSALVPAEKEHGKGIFQRVEPISFEFFHCEKCSFHVPASRIAFDTSNLGKSTWCNFCKKSWPVKTWKCKCDVNWHICNTHKQAPDDMRRGQPPKAKPSARDYPERELKTGCLPSHMTTEASNPKDKKAGQESGRSVVKAVRPNLWGATDTGDAKCIELSFTMKEREAIKRKLPIMGQFEDRLICRSNCTARGSSVKRVARVTQTSIPGYLPNAGSLKILGCAEDCMDLEG
jgi:hypothetical protein